MSGQLKSDYIEGITAKLDNEFGWGLTTDDKKRYSSSLIELLSGNESEEQLRQIIERYHLDHNMVNGLSDKNDPHHDEYWAAWWPQILRILNRTGLAWTDDVATDTEDLAQLAMSELARNLPNFKYNSRFSTWAHQVITRSVQRALRDMHAKKRAARPTSIDELPETVMPAMTNEIPEDIESDAFVSLALETLGRDGDPRLQEMFKMWQLEEASIAEIVKRVKLSPTRVRALLARARDILRNEPSIRAWNNEE